MLKLLVEPAQRLDGLSYYGKVTTVVDTTHFKVDGLAGWGDDYFNGWYVYVVRDAGGAGAAPQNEMQPITDYTSSDGTFTHTAFTTPLAVGDEVLIIHDLVGKILDLKTEKFEVHDVVIYLAAEDRATTELDSDGSSPNYLPESSQSNANEAAGEANPAWIENFDFEQNGTITVISIYAELHWAQKQTGGGTSYVKIQISGDGGCTWVDMTDNVAETTSSYVDKTRIGVGRWITSITAGTNKLQLRACQWGGTTSSEFKLREDSYLRITYRKS